VVGFSSSSGIGNLFTECVSEGTNKTSSVFGADVFGFLLTVTEAESKIIHCIANSTNLVGEGTAYGIFVTAGLPLLDSANYGSFALSVDWLTSGTNTYLAVGGLTPSNGDEIQIFSFDGSNLSLIDSENYGLLVNSVDWLMSGNNIFLAVGGRDPINGDEIQIFSFDGSLLTTVTSENYGSRVLSVDWLTSGTNTFLAVGGRDPINGDEIQIFSFDGSNLSLEDSANYGAFVLSVDWLTSGTNIYLAVGGVGPSFPNDEISIFSFDGSNLSFVTSENYGSQARSVNWLTSGTNTYLAVGGLSPDSPNDEISIFSFDGLDLSFVDSKAYGTQVTSVNWLTTCTNTYLAVGGAQPTSGDEIQIFSFDGSNLSGPIISADYGGFEAFSVAWLNDNTLAVGGSTSSKQEIQLYSFFPDFVKNCLIDSNRVCNTTGGIGIFGDSDDNDFIKNIAYANDTNFSSDIVNVFDDGLIDDPNKLDNISLLSTTTNCIKTISLPGVYKIDANQVCCITIDSDDVTVDLNGFTLTCATSDAITVNAGHKNIEIKNGCIKGDGNNDGIFINPSCEFVRIENVNIYDCNNGIKFGVAFGSEVKGCSAVNCAFDSCNKGVFAQHLVKSVFENCIASNCVQSGFELCSSQFNVFDKCKALKTGEGSASSVDVSGFSSAGGRGNLYTECVAEGTDKILSSVGADAFGFSLLSTETESKIINCIANSTSLVGAGTAYGIFVNNIAQDFSLMATANYGSTTAASVSSVDWLTSGTNTFFFLSSWGF